MIAKCPLCGKVFDVLWPNMWRFRRDRRYLFSWGCMRALDDQKGENKDMALSKAQKQQVIEMLLNGENPNDFIKQCGIKNPTCTVWNLKNYLKKYDPETWKKIQPKPETPETVPAPISGGEWEKIETPEGPAPTCCQPARPSGVTVPDELPVQTYERRYTAVETSAGDFQYFRKQGYLDWTPLDGSGAVSLTIEEWKEFLRVFPLMAADLGVEV